MFSSRALRRRLWCESNSKSSGLSSSSCQVSGAAVLQHGERAAPPAQRPAGPPLTRSRIPLFVVYRAARRTTRQARGRYRSCCGRDMPE